MRIFLEFDGVFTDLKAAWWSAYRSAVAKVGLATTDEVTFWRLVRTGADDGQLIKGAKEHHIKAFRDQFTNTLEQDDVISLQELRTELSELVKRLERFGPCNLVTLGSNIAARKNVLSRGNLAFLQDRLLSLASPVAATAADLRSSMGDQAEAVVLASSDSLVRAADQAGMKPIGIAGGAVIARRLASSGAIATFPSLSAFKEALEEGTIDGLNRFR